MSQYQEKLVSGTNIKTVNGNSILGSGNVTIHNVPSGGTAGQVLTKQSDTDNDTDWEDIPFVAPITGQLTLLALNWVVDQTADNVFT